jgi:hypothetical protein
MGEILKSIGATYNNGILFFLIIHRWYMFDLL